MARLMSVFPIIAALMAMLCLGEQVDETLESIQASFENLKSLLDYKDKIVADLTRQIMLDRFQDEERIRAEGQSGIFQVRNYHVGTDNYHSSSFVGENFGSFHDMENYRNLLGMGETRSVMNGVQFQTRQSDYLVQRPSTTSKAWHAMEPIPPAPVPQTVLDKSSVEDQIIEMREYFRAFKEQNTTIRDYRPYFKPLLCYMEGAWMSNYEDIEDAFPNLRHKYSAVSWFDQMEKARLAAYLGSPWRTDQNNANMPTTITGINKTTMEPIYAQWNYRILCYPVEEEIPTSYFKIRDDISYRFPYNVAYEDLDQWRGAHYVLDDSDIIGPHFEREEGILDRLVARIPGKDNIPDMMNENDFGLDQIKDITNMNKKIHQGYYNRRFFDRFDASDHKLKVRGFNDPSMFMALTTQPEVAPLSVTVCTTSSKCLNHNIRASYMFPLEVVYQSPLHEWNPWNLTFFEGPTNKAPANSVYEGGRRGFSNSSAYKGTNEALFYRVPEEFYLNTNPTDRDTMDSGYNLRYILDPQNVPRKVAPSGYKMVLPPIPGVGHVRMRYPIAPVHEEGSAVYKELNAFKRYLAEQLSKLAEKNR